MLTEIKISSRHISLLIKALIILNILLLGGTFLVNSQNIITNEYLRLILYQFDLATENILAAWYSSVLLFFTSLLSVFCFLADNTYFRTGKEHILNYGWLVLTACFAALSFDELGSIHEHIGEHMGFSEAGGALLGEGSGSGWKLFYILVGVVGAFMMLFSFMRLAKARWSLLFLLLGLMCYLSNPFQEHFEIESMRSSADPLTWKRPVHFLIIEEGSEIFGSLFFIVSLLMYAKYTTRRNTNTTDGIELTLNTSNNQLLRWSVLLLIFLSACVIIVAVMFPVAYAERQAGVPRNWFPSMMAIAVFLYCLYHYADPGTYGSNNKRSLLIFCVFCVLMSVYYGTDRLSYIFNSGHYRSSILIRVFVMITAFISFIQLAGMLVNRRLKIALSVSLILLIAGVFTPRLYAPEIGFVAFAISLSVLMFNSLHVKRQ